MGLCKVIQINLNNSWAAYDLLGQYMLENDIDLAVISEPPRGIRDCQFWIPSRDGSAAVYWKYRSSSCGSCTLLRRFDGIVAVKTNDIVIVLHFT